MTDAAPSSVAPPTPGSDGAPPPGRWRWAVPLALVAATGAVVAVLAATGTWSPDDRTGAGTGAGSGGPSRSRSSTIAIADDATVWLTSPDDDQLVAVDPETLAVLDRVEVSAQPQELTILGDRAVVTSARAAELTVAELDGAAVAQATAVAVPCGGTRGVATIPAGVGGATADLAVATCPRDDRIVVVDLGSPARQALVEVGARPTGVARDGEEVVVTTAGDGQLRTYAAADLVAALDGADPATVAPVATREAWADGERSPSQLGAIDVGVEGPVAGYQIVDNVRKLSSSQIEGDATYGTPLDGRARLEPALAGPCGARFGDFADPARLLSGPVAVAAAPAGALDPDLVWVVGQYSQSVSVVRCAGADDGGGAARSPTVASFSVGDGARGIALADDGATAFVDVGFDHEVARLRLPSEVGSRTGASPIERQAPEAVARRDVTDRYLSPLAQEGRRMFADASDEHLTPFGVVTCASCHPDAGDDGLAWRIETQEIDPKLRRTPPVWALDASAKPLHWDGQFASADELALDTIQELLGGDGLLVDTAAITAYMAEVPAPIGPPALDEADRAARAAGEALFTSDALGCATCHQGTAGTDGERHDVLERTGAPASDLDAVATPTLTGARGRAPFGHDGRAATLGDLLASHRGADGEPFELTDDQVEDLLAYLRTR